MRHAQHPTLSDVARRAGVGTATVSRVINGGSRVSAKTLELVLRTIEELGFVPNVAARVLKGEQSRTIGLIVPSIADPFFANCAETIQKVARSFGSLLVVTVSHNDPVLELDNIETLFRRTDGLLIAPSNSHDRALVDRLATLSIPVVCFDRPLRDAPISAILTDNYHCAKLATRHLLEHGYRDIVCFGGEASFYTMVERVRGYKAAMREARGEVRVDMTPYDRSAKEIEDALALRIRENSLPRAIFCLKNSITMHTYHALQRLQRKVPDQVALLGYDDFELAETLRPSITVVQQPVEEIGRKAASLLFQRLTLGKREPHSKSHATETLFSRSRIILRASCGCKEIEQDLHDAGAHLVAKSA